MTSKVQRAESLGLGLASAHHNSLSAVHMLAGLLVVVQLTWHVQGDQAPLAVTVCNAPALGGAWGVLKLFRLLR